MRFQMKLLGNDSDMEIKAPDALTAQVPAPAFHVQKLRPAAVLSKLRLDIMRL